VGVLDKMSRQNGIPASNLERKILYYVPELLIIGTYPE
jgi:hypothetical protein